MRLYVSLVFYLVLLMKNGSTVSRYLEDRVDAAQRSDEVFKLKRHIDDLKEDLGEAKKVIQGLERKKNDLFEVYGEVLDENKSLEELHQQTLSDLYDEKDKRATLIKQKNTLEQQVHDLEHSFEREKKARMDLERAKRKLENDYKATSETIMDLENDKHQCEEKGKKSEFETNRINARLEDEQSLVAQLQKKVKEFQARIENLEEELESKMQK
jgi:chromosome segregation ATPase